MQTALILMEALHVNARLDTQGMEQQHAQVTNYMYWLSEKLIVLLLLGVSLPYFAMKQNLFTFLPKNEDNGY